MITRFSMKKAIVLFFALLLTMGTAAAQGSGSTALKRIAETKTLRVGMTGTQPPFNAMTRDGKLMGLDVDLAQLLALAMRVELEIVETPFSDLLTSLEKGSVDIVISGMTATLQRNSRVPFVGPYHVSGKSILTKSTTLSAIESSEELNSKNVRVAAMRGSTSEEFVKIVLDDQALTSTADHAEAVRLLLDGKVDAVVADMPVCVLSILRNPDAGLVTLATPLTIEPIGIAVAPGDPLLVNLVENYLQAMQATGILEALEVEWFENGDWLAKLP
jgi:polar amino acid transport system substrate-binding protein